MNALRRQVEEMVEQKGADIELSASVDRRDILPGGAGKYIQSGNFPPLK